MPHATTQQIFLGDRWCLLICPWLGRYDGGQKTTDTLAGNTQKKLGVLACPGTGE